MNAEQRKNLKMWGVRNKMARIITITEKELTEFMYKHRKEMELKVALHNYHEYQKVQLKQLERIKDIAYELKKYSSKTDKWFKSIKDEELKKVIKSGGVLKI